MEFKPQHKKNKSAAKPVMDGGEALFFKPRVIQRKLKINQPGDAYEKEADEVAEKVVQPGTGKNGQRTGNFNSLISAYKPANIQREEAADDTALMEDEEERNATTENEPAEEVSSGSDEERQEEKENPGEIMTKGEHPNTSTRSPASDFSASLADTKNGGSSLPGALKGEMESAFGRNFSSVKLHTDEKAAQLNDNIQARAFTNGCDIYFNRGQYQPESTDGKKLLAHELTHVVQQSSNGQPSVQRSFWSSIKKAAGAVWSGVKKVGSAIGSGVKKAGKWIAGGAKWIWGKLKWFGGQLIDKIAGIFQRFAYWLSQLPTRVARLMSTLWNGLKTFKPWTLTWWKSLAKLDTWKDFLKWIGTSFLDILEVIGFGEAYETVMDFIKFNTRVLSAAEVKAGKSIFGYSINFDFVRVDQGAIIGPAFTKRAYTSFHTINTWGKETMDVIIHELTHVWQYEHAGAIYMPQAIHAQAWGAGYNYGDVAGLQARKTAGKGLLSFNREQQAQIVQDFFQLRQTGSVAGGSATSADLPLYVDFVKTVSTLSVADLMTPI